MTADQSKIDQRKRANRRREGGGGIWVYASFGLSILILSYTMWSVVKGTFSADLRPSTQSDLELTSDSQMRLTLEQEENLEIRQTAFRRQHDLVERVRRRNESRQAELRRATEILSLDAKKAQRNFDERKLQAQRQLDEWRQKNADRPHPPEDSVEGRRIRELELMAAGRD